jgi:hypothetical protein
MSITGIGEVANTIGGILDKLFPDKTEAEKSAAAYQIALLQAEQQDKQMQTDVNKTEAGSANMFVAGWRPFIGWVCGSGLGFTFIVAPLATWGARLAGKEIVFPELDMGTLMTLLFGMLGLGGMRTVEKVSGVKKVGH